jgi:23S rRNA pseudouridine2605 synthase
MDRHPKDNDKKPRSRQDDGARGPRNFADKGPRKPFDKDAKPGGKPRDRAGGKPGDKSAPEAKGPERTERIAKAMARAGIASRREVERLIGLGKVAVNGRILATPAVLVTRDDKITVDGKPIGAAQATRVWRYHKPAGLITSHNDPAGRPTVFDALPSGLPRVISVGRLDLATEGLLLLTNDGELSRALELPETALVRQYRARARGRITQEQLDKLKDGVVVDGVRYGPVEATIDKAKEKTEGEKSSANLWLSVSITEGKNREVRKVLESIGLTVNRLIRLAYGPFQLGTLPVGSVEEVGPRVIREMLAEHIRPENLPTGNTVATPAPIPGVAPARRSCAASPARPCRIRRASPAAFAPPRRRLKTAPSSASPLARKAGPRPNRSSNTRRPSSRAPVQAMTKGRKAAIVRAVRSRRANRAPTSSSTTVAVRPRAAVPAESPAASRSVVPVEPVGVLMRVRTLVRATDQAVLATAANRSEANLSAASLRAVQAVVAARADAADY